MNVWAVPAATFDLDVTIDMTPEEVHELVSGLEEIGFVPPVCSYPNKVGRLRFPKTKVQFYFEDRPFDVDIYFATHPYQKEAIARRKQVQLSKDLTSWVLVPEDLLIHKLIAYRAKDRVAIERLLVLQPDMDWRYVMRWCERLKMKKRLLQTLKEANLYPDLR